MMDLEDLKHFDVASLMRDATGQPLALRVDHISPDPDNLRTRIDPEALRELAESIRENGLIHPVSVRPRADRPGHYFLNAGERRWRAVQRLGWETIEAIVREGVNPYLQAVENLQREGLDLLDLARWIARREAAGERRETIARRLGKPASFITEAAVLNSAPEEIVRAVAQGRLADTRSAYLLTRAWARNADTVRELLAVEAPLTREAVASALASPPPPLTSATSPTSAPTEGRPGRGGARRARGGGEGRERPGALALEVDVAGRVGRLELRPPRTRTSAWVGLRGRVGGGGGAGGDPVAAMGHYPLNSAERARRAAAAAGRFGLGVCWLAVRLAALAAYVLLALGDVFVAPLLGFLAVAIFAFTMLFGFLLGLVPLPQKWGMLAMAVGLMWAYFLYRGLMLLMLRIVRG
jgi:ParB family chromosome partitioning protein